MAQNAEIGALGYTVVVHPDPQTTEGSAPMKAE